MAMKDTINVLNRMAADGIVSRYAIGGAVAAYNYVEAASTDDLDVLVSLDRFESTPGSGLVTLGPIIEYLKDLGYDTWEKEGLMIEGWAVQFLPVSNALSLEALEQAVDVEMSFFPSDPIISTRVLSAEHVMATALETGRPKDFTRLISFIETYDHDVERFCRILTHHDLIDKWRSFCYRFEIVDVCLDNKGLR
ncbi:MAG: hypothetical protein ACRC7C_18920 [Beijerinckiaceae bacterium]